MATKQATHKPMSPLPGNTAPAEDPQSQADAETALTDQIRALAYELWLDRGSPVGSPEVDWLEAEDRLQRLNRR